MLEKYDYLKAVKDDVKDYIEKHDIDLSAIPESDLYDELWVSEVTGNDSKVYSKTDVIPAVCLSTNFDLLAKALESFKVDVSFLSNGPEVCDIACRCYILDQAIMEIYDEYSDSIYSE